MSEQKEYELVVEVRYIVKADNVHDAIDRWNNGDYGDITTEEIVDVIKI